MHSTADASALPDTSSDNHKSVAIDFANTYTKLPARFFSRTSAMPVPAPRLIKINAPLALQLGLDPAALATPEGIAVLSGNRVATGSEPIALAYAGHQFGHFVPQLGDGRALLLGEVIAHDGNRYDIQLKGSGPTAFSRRGDGRAALGPVLREYILSEAMDALGVPTTRALAAVTTGQKVVRETVLPGGIFTRVAASHLRVGSFQYFAARSDVEGTKILADYAIARHYPEAALAVHPYRAFLDGVISRQARLVAQWMLIGFIHGVMNTDNTSISGETIDYGPCAFLEAYDPAKVYSSIDQQGRYAYGNQPAMMLWNLTRLAESLLPFISKESGSDEAGLASARESLDAFEGIFNTALQAGLRRKLGLSTHREGDEALAVDLLSRMAANRADFTLTFRTLCDAASTTEADTRVRALFADPTSYDEWAVAWRRRLESEPASAQERADAMRAANPSIIPRNHRVQAVIDAAVEREDFQLFEEMLDAVSRPYEDRPDLELYTRPARPEESVIATFCGT
jgi:uncharacterized protein YdiU (UPF0061 family)